LRRRDDSTAVELVSPTHAAAAAAGVAAGVARREAASPYAAAAATAAATAPPATAATAAQRGLSQQRQLLTSMTVAQLKIECKKAGVKCSGKKAVLVDRLLQVA
jgi:hypothetical protein